MLPLSWSGPAALSGSLLVRSPERSLRLFRARLRLLVDREAVGERPHLALDRFLHERRGAVRRLRSRVEDFGDETADLLELGDAEPARRAGRRAKPDPRSDEGLFRVIGHAILVAGEPGPDERLLRQIALEPLRPEIDQHQMVVGPSRDNIEPGGPQRFGKRAS